MKSLKKVLSVVLAVSAILKMHNEFRIIKNAVISLNASLSDKDMLKYFPLPAVICKTNGKILWFNDLFKAAVIRNRQPISEVDFELLKKNSDYTGFSSENRRKIFGGVV